MECQQGLFHAAQLAGSFPFGCMFKKREVEGQIAEDGGQHGPGQTTTLTCICPSYRLCIFIRHCICSEASKHLGMPVASRTVVGKGTSTWVQIEEQDVFFPSLSILVGWT